MSENPGYSQSPAQVSVSSADQLATQQQIKEDPIPSGQPPLAQPVFAPTLGQPYDGQQQPYCVMRSQTGRITEIVLRLDIRYIKSIPGILNILLFVALTVAWGCCGEVNRWYTLPKTQFALFAYITAWMLVLFFFIIHSLQIHKAQSFPQFKWPIVCLVVHSVWMVFVLIGSALLASEARIFARFTTLNTIPSIRRLVNNFWAALVFGFVSWALLLANLFFYFIDCNDIRRRQRARMRFVTAQDSQVQSPSAQPAQLQFMLPREQPPQVNRPQGDQPPAAAFQEVKEDA